MPCPFCDRADEKHRILVEKEYCYVMLSNPRLMPGHLLVIPKRHVEKPSEMGEAERREVFDTVIEFQDKITARYATGCDVRQNYRPFLKESAVKVDHVHYHLLPREFEDEMYRKTQNATHELFSPLTEEEGGRFKDLYK
jgi:ATP adenylyltransferase